MKKIISVGLLWSMFLVMGVFAQDPTQMTLTELVAAANTASQQDDPGQGIPFLEEIIKRSTSFTEMDALRSAQQVRLQLSQIYAQRGQWGDAEKYATAYISQKPCADPAIGLSILCQANLIREDWAGLKKNAQDLFNEPRKKSREKERAELFLAQAHYNLEEYESALKFIPLVLERADDPDTEADLRLMRARCLFETGQGDSLLADLSKMIQGDARYDIHLNLFLLRMADDLYERDSLSNALAVYRLVVPRAELAEWMETMKTQLEQKIARMEEKAMEKAADQDEDAAEKVNEKIDKLESELDSLQDAPEYDLHIAYRIAEIYADKTRFWEAVAAFDDIYQRYPQEMKGQSAFFEKVQLLDDLEQDEEAIALSRDYLENNRSGLYPRMVTSYLMRYYYVRKNIPAVLDVFGYTDGWAAPDNSVVRSRETGLRYMVCFAWLEQSNYSRAAAAFESVIEFSPDSQSAADSHYWRAMCSLMQQDYQDAHDRFVRFRLGHPDSSFAPAALFRTAVSRFGMQDYEGAKESFDEFIQSNPNNPLLPEALSMRGDLLGGDGKLDEALADYRKAVELSGKFYAQTPDSPALGQIILPATYALSQTARTLELDAAAYRDEGDYDLCNEKYRQIITEAKHYEELFGDKADFAQSVFIQSKAQFQLGEADKAVRACIDVVGRYGADPAAQGVTDILAELGAMIQTRLDEDQRKQALSHLRQVREQSDSRTLQLRLDVLLAEVDGTQADIGRRLLAGEKSLEAIPPSALGLMCSAAFEQRDFSRAEELFNFFAMHYDDSSFINSAYRLRAEDLFQRKEYDQAMALAQDALEVFGAVRDLGWAQLMKGRSELVLQQYSQAAETFNGVFNVPQWRGPLYAEAMLLMADAWFAQDDFEKAFAFYQRTYLLYQFYDDGRWAADAYLKSADCLYKLKRASAARNTYRAMLLDEAVRDLPQADTAKKVLGPEETVELLAGQTNRLEAVSTEMEL